jgi:hypothetical protein
VEQRKRPNESHDQAVRRLAEVARERGLAVHWHDCGPRREYYVTSAGSPGLLHRCTLVSCDCEGFVRHGRCTHHSALLAELDELPPLPEPPTPEPMATVRGERVEQWHINNERHARRLLEGLIERERQGERIAERDWQEATAMVALYAGITGSNQAPALAA